MAEWIKFSDRLPSANDAAGGLVFAQWLSLRTGQTCEGPCLWDWIPPSQSDAKELWAVNGFIAWRPHPTRATHRGGSDG